MSRILDDEAKFALKTRVVKDNLLPSLLKLHKFPVKKATMQERQPRREEAKRSQQEEAKRSQQAGPVIRSVDTLRASNYTHDSDALERAFPCLLR